MAFWNNKKIKEVSAENKKIKNLIAKADEVPGWLAPEAAFFSAQLLEYQKNIKLEGNIVEIGVYHGKYLAILYQYLNLINERILGIDAFIGSDDVERPKNIVFDNILKVCGNNQSLDFIVEDSLALTSDQLFKFTQVKNVRFISIDGGHTAEIVSHDLKLATAILKEGGVIAMDDIFNHSLPGVTEGLFQFMHADNSPALAPFAHCYNKLFLTTPNYYDDYFKQAFCILEEMKDFNAYERTWARIKEDRSYNFSPELLGYEVLCFM